MAFWPDKILFVFVCICVCVFAEDVHSDDIKLWIIGRMVLNLLTLSFFDTIWLFWKLYTVRNEQERARWQSWSKNKKYKKRERIYNQTHPNTSNQCQTCRTVVKIIETVKWNKNANGSRFEKVFTNSFVRWPNFSLCFVLLLSSSPNCTFTLTQRRRANLFTPSMDSFISIATCFLPFNSIPFRFPIQLLSISFEYRSVCRKS